MRALFFTAPWCAACRGVKPHAIAACNSAGIELVMVDVDADPEEAIRHHVSSLPTIVLEENGVEIDRMGTVGQAELSKRINDARRE